MNQHRWAFVLRLWDEQEPTADDDQRLLRGSLHEVQSGQTHYFTSLSQVLVILERLIDLPDDEPPTPRI